MAGGRKPGTKKTGGRIAGTPNKSTAEIRALAQVHGPAAIKKLAYLMENGESESTQQQAAKDLLERGYGKPPQDITVGGDPDKPIVHKIEFVIVDPPNRDG
jgi:hypothetical protein